MTGSIPVGPASQIREFFLIGNWKMYGSIYELQEFCANAFPAESGVCPIVCPPFLYCAEVAKQLPLGYALGGQDCSEHTDGSYTGQISARMLKDVGCQYVLLGHSERRLQETQDSIKEKNQRAVEAGLTPIVCIGEKEASSELSELSWQLDGLPKETGWIAYEPRWCIGGAVLPSKEHLYDVFQRHLKGYTFLYGGAVNMDTIDGLLQSVPCLSGILVGRAARDVALWNQLLIKIENMMTHLKNDDISKD